MKKIVNLLMLAPLLFTSCGNSGLSGHYKDDKVNYEFTKGTEEDFKNGVKTGITDTNEISNQIIDKLKLNSEGPTDDGCLQLFNDHGINVTLENGGGNVTFYPCNYKKIDDTFSTSAAFDYGKIKDKYHFVKLDIDATSGNVNINSYTFLASYGRIIEYGKETWYRGTWGNTDFEITDTGLKANFLYLGEYCEKEPDIVIIPPSDDEYEVVYSINFTLEYNKVS